MRVKCANPVFQFPDRLRGRLWLLIAEDRRSLLKPMGYDNISSTLKKHNVTTSGEDGITGHITA